MRHKETPGRAVLAAIEQGRIRSAYLLIGDNTPAIDELIRRIKDKCVDPGFEPFDFESLYADDDIDPTIVVQHVRQPPTGSPRRMVVIKNITRMGSKGPVFARTIGRPGVETLLAGMASTPDDACMVVTGVAKKELGSLITKYGLKDCLVEVKQPGAGDLLVFIRRSISKRGLRIEDDAAHLLLATVGEDVAMLRTEVEKLVTCFESGDVITADKVRELASASRAFTLREYVDRVMRRDVPGALDVLRRLQTWGAGRDELPRIISWLTGAFIDHVAVRAGALPPNLHWKVRYTEKHWPATGELNRCLQQLYRINRGFVTGEPEPWARLEAFTICIACPGNPDYCDVYTDGREHNLCMIPPRKKNNG
jgi:DNA polymerase-3 subunit delta